ncbi:plasmid stabilization protein [Synechococcus sp. Tobar12-5m-g]|jgi:plasmid stability protein|uniref:FitA-like ribbon-helix-helix domain-containing protein n=1 Tax=unclassified Synechococcus TaxID=2626047 RepID=UPI0020CE02C9|nr:MULTISPECIES: plasmid stabilization protein [unclassified Synechococcus]MCP9773821.1 plasmid stabilization protein [Synechococcus sp. Tobar12-5m-g]MCP9874836.1 plasmid stabilization protein [Synechococcus sp. Cruz CV-v-12]
MASLTIRNLDDTIKAQLRLQAARHGRSMEEEARTILRQAVVTQPPEAEGGRGLGSRIHAHFAALGGVDLDLPAGASTAEGAGFGEEPL